MKASVCAIPHLLQLRYGHISGHGTLARPGLPAQTFTFPEPLMLFRAVLHTRGRQFAYFGNSGPDLMAMLPVFDGTSGHSHNGRDLLIRLAVLCNHLSCRQEYPAPGQV